MTPEFANSTIRPPQGLWEILHENGSTQDIINVILLADSESKGDTKKFAKAFTSANLKPLWQFVRKHITYKLDPQSIEKVKSPSATWKDGYADCKSMSIFITSVLKNMGIAYKYRFVAWDSGDVTHVYPVAIVNGKEIIMDAVHTKFNDEVPFHHGYDYYPNYEGNFTKKKISGIPNYTGIAAIIIALAIATKIMS